MQGAHPRLACGIHAREDLLRLSNGVIIQVGNQSVGGGPGLLFRFTDDHMQANTVLQGYARAPQHVHER
ncbi:Uncharacterised protein [Raoultella planticola]|uniref:Uncharacterized protein n=1 Tax=Raoultella planticola TaxID=575 RepID=A0A485BQ03_RAOPL|nr:Uncharacterised protein [Raoultella planticola]